MDIGRRMSLSWLLLVCCSIHCSQAAQHCCSNPNNRCVYNLSFLAFVPCTHLTDARDCDLFVYPAMLQAKEDINSNGSILRNGEYESLSLSLDLKHIVTQNDLAYTIYTFITDDPEQFDGLLGPGSNKLAEIVGFVTGKKLPMLLVSYGATDILFNEQKARYPYLYRTIPSEEALNRATICLMKELGWKRAAILSSSNQVYTRVAENLYNFGKAANIYLERRTFYFEASSIITDWVRIRIKILIGIFGPLEARQVICEVSRVNDAFLDYTHVWLLPHYFSPTWWELDNETLYQLPILHRCDNTEMFNVLNDMNLLFVSSLKYNMLPGSSEGDSREAYHLQTSTNTFIDKLMDRTKEQNLSAEISKLLLRQSQAAAAYDSVWVLALAHYELIKQNKTEILLDDLNKALVGLDFNGLTKRHSFRSGQDLGASFLVSQFKDGVIKPARVISSLPQNAKDSCSSFFLSLNESLMLPGFSSYLSDFIWQEGRLPSDGFLVENSVITVKMFAISCAIIVFSLSVCIAVLIIIVIFKNNRHIKASNPRFTCVAIIGFMTVIPSSIIKGLNFSAIEYNFSHSLNDFLCTLSFPACSVGLIIAYSVLIAKNWRIYRIFNHSMHYYDINGISTCFLYGISAMLSLPYIVVIVVSLSVSRAQGTFKEEIISPSLLKNYSFCEDRYKITLYWQSFLFLYEGLLLLMLLYLSYKNSTIKQALFMEEGQSGARMVLAITVVSLLMLIVLIFLEEKVEKYLYEYWCLLLYTTQSPMFFCAVLFIPKCIAIYRDYRTKKKKKRSNRIISEISSMQNKCDQLKKDLEEKEAYILRLRAGNRTSSSSCDFVAASSACANTNYTFS